MRQTEACHCIPDLAGIQLRNRIPLCLYLCVFMRFQMSADCGLPCSTEILQENRLGFRSALWLSRAREVRGFKYYWHSAMPWVLVLLAAQVGADESIANERLLFAGSAVALRSAFELTQKIDARNLRVHEDLFVSEIKPVSGRRW